MKAKYMMGIDIGGSGIKGAIVDIKRGKAKTDKYRLPTPNPSTPKAVAETIKQIADHFDWKGPIGVGFPGVMQHGVVKTAANIDSTWLDVNLEKLISKHIGVPCIALNDADAAGVAEMRYGAGKKNKGLVVVLTIGTGIGCAMFTQGKLVPNCELGHICMPGGIEDAEKWTSDAARKTFELEWNDWMTRLETYIKYVESLFWPDLVIIGGGLSKKLEKKGFSFKTQCKVVPAKLLNEAGIIGAALAAKNLLEE